MAKFTENPILSSRFSEALVYANELHIKQIRKGGREAPYISHLLSVAAIVLENGGDEDMAIAALLHDSVEDIKIDISEIESKFGAYVAKIVSSLSEDKNLSTKKERKQSYIDNIKFANGNAVVLVSCADKLHNLRSYLKAPELITVDVVWFYNQLFPIYEQWLNNSLIEEMRELLDKMRQIKGIESEWTMTEFV